MKFKKSQELLQSVKKLIPTASMTLSKAYDQVPENSYPIFIDKASGCEVWDVDGNRFIDYIGGLGPVFLGYNNYKVNKAIKKQLKKGIVFSLPSTIEFELAKLLNEIIPSAEQVRYGKTGTDVCTAAVRLARYVTGKEHILGFNGHYHGWTFWANAAGRPLGVIDAEKQYVDKVDYNDLGAVEEKFKTGKYAALIMEPMTFVIPAHGFLYGLRALCDEYGVLLIFDEIVSGRLALGGAQEYFKVTPDLSTFSKHIANGMPLSILCGKEKYMQYFDKVFFSGSFFGETLSIAAAIATIKHLKETKNIYKDMWDRGTQLQGNFNGYAKQIGLNAQMIGVGPRLTTKFGVVDEPGCKDLFRQEMCKNGVLVGPQIYTTPAHKEKHINKTVTAMFKSLDVINKAVKEKNIDKYLDGERSGASKVIPIRKV